MTTSPVCQVHWDSPERSPMTYATVVHARVAQRLLPPSLPHDLCHVYGFVYPGRPSSRGCLYSMLVCGFGQQSAIPALHLLHLSHRPFGLLRCVLSREIFCEVFRSAKCVLSRKVFCEVFRDWVFRRLLAVAMHRFLANGLLTNSSRFGSPSGGPPSMIFEERALAFV